MMRRLTWLTLVPLLLSACVASGSATPTGPTGEPSASTPTAQAPTWSPPPVPSTFDGRAVLTVSAAIAARDGGRLGQTSLLLGGYWSMRPYPASCPYPGTPPAELEMYCMYGQGGITEAYEAILTIYRDATSMGADPPVGPSLVPWVPPELVGTLRSPALAGGDPPHAPVPIVVSGHFDDRRAADCRPGARQQCRERFVIEAIVLFDPAAAPPATPSPPPTPFPSPHPPGLFPPEHCNGDVPYSFVGWTTTDELNSSADHSGHVWATVTRDVLPIGGWGEDPNLPPGHFVRGWGRRVCLATERMGTEGMEFNVVNGTAHGEWADGRRTPADAYGPESGDDTYVESTPPPLPPEVRSEMHGVGVAPVTISIRDWSGSLVDARPATDGELGAAAAIAEPAAAMAMPDDPRSLLVLWAECGSDRAATVIIVHDRATILIKGDARMACDEPGARRASVLTFDEPVPPSVAAVTGL